MPTFTVTLGPGETIVLPSDAIITGVFSDGNATLTSSCTGEITESTAYKCGVFYMNIDDDSNNNHPNDEVSTYYRGLYIGDLFYELDGTLNGTLDPDFLNAYVPPQGLFTFTHITKSSIDDSGTNKRQAIYLYFKVAETFFDDVQLYVVSHVGNLVPNPQYYYPLTEDEQEGAGDLECNSFPF